MRLAVRPRRPVFLRKGHWLALAGMLALSLLAMPAAPAQAHFLGRDSVDGREIRYEDYTRFDEARLWAIQSWNALGSVKIAPDKWNTVTDLEFRDERRCDLAWGAWWQARKGADVIVFNTCRLEAADPLIVRSVAMHELGHALGLDHSFEGNIMAPGIRYLETTNGQAQLYLGPHDIEDYRALWG